MIQATHPGAGLEALAELGAHYPQMRFGQLVLFAATLALDGDARELLSTSDEALLRAAEDHLHSGRSGRGPSPTPPALGPAELLKLARARHGASLLNWLDTLARRARSTLYDIEDEPLLAAARLGHSEDA